MRNKKFYNINQSELTGSDRIFLVIIDDIHREIFFEQGENFEFLLENFPLLQTAN